LPAFIMSQVEPRFDMSRLIFIRENSSKMYSQFAFVASAVVAEIPYGLLSAAVVHSFLLLVADSSIFSAFISRPGLISSQLGRGSNS
jgi:ABC-2 type transporter